MTNEQREAIEELKSLSPSEGAIDIVLSLIKEQQEEIEKYKALYERALSDLVKADKQIDLMAEKLVQAHEWFYSEFDNFTKEDFIEYFERKVEDVKD